MTNEAMIEELARALGKSHGLDFDEVCGVTADPDGGYCDSGTCIASGYEDHDPDYARSCYRSDARAILPIIERERTRHGNERYREGGEAAVEWHTDRAEDYEVRELTIRDQRAREACRLAGKSHRDAAFYISNLKDQANAD